MTAEFKKYAEDLLRDVPENVSNTVNKAIAESLKRYPSLDPDFQNVDHICGVERSDIAASHVATDAIPTTDITAIPAPSHHIPASPIAEDRSQLHEREKEFHGLFTPSYLPLLDGDRNERKSISDNHSPSETNRIPINIVFRGRSSEDRSIATATSLYPSSPSVPLGKPLTPAQRNTDEGSLGSDHSDTPVRRSALRRSSSSSKPASPRHVRFEFEGQEFPTTSSPQSESPTLEAVAENVITTTVSDDSSDNEAGSQQVEYIGDSAPPKRISSTQALRALSRGWLEDDGTKWTEVSAPPDGSASVPNVEAENEDSEDESLSISITRRAGPSLRTNGHVEGDATGHNSTKSASSTLTGVEAISTEQTGTRNRQNPDTNISNDENDILAEMPPLEHVKARIPMAGGATLAALEAKYADKTQTVATAASSKPWFNLEDGSDLNGSPGSPLQLADDEVFAFDEAPPRNFENTPEDEEEPDFSSSETEGKPVHLSQYATSPAVPIFPPSISSYTPKSPVPTQSSSHRSSYHPFNTPIVSEAIHAQAASLGHVATFVGSLHWTNGFDESDVQSFRGSGGIGSFAGGVPRSFSERLAMEDAMENQLMDQRKK
jgi:hypothetical protein